MLVATPDEILWKGLEMAYCKKKAEKKTKKKSTPPLRSFSDLSFSDSLFQRFKNSFSVLKIVSAIH